MGSGEHLLAMSDAPMDGAAAIEAAMARALGPIEVRLDQVQQQQRALSESLFALSNGSRGAAKKKGAAADGAKAGLSSVPDPLTTGDLIYLEVSISLECTLSELFCHAMLQSSPMPAHAVYSWKLN